ncbi:cytochrome c oxidase assembly factor 3, mitochondrial-like [Gigantopelta aegis]|uniref:cytochrome c oxidase assembly factor 3, mitochondrial-like n=1 Tax=Gigantopelta aegis TaxID=1735272 RepID=UPI001B88C408|nr:cytochrome c oxidase assembly factor 3, mitochondrial-like [Gigantopelta aegis]
MSFPQFNDQAGAMLQCGSYKRRKIQQNTRKMAEANRMEKVDMTKEFNKLGESDKHYIRKLETMNLDRAKELRGLRNRNRYTAVFLGVAVLSIYGYSMYAVRQEKFLEDFDTVPEQSHS